MKPNEIAELPPIRRNTPSEMREVIDAIEAGKPIQYKCVDDGETVAWRDTIVIAPNFHFNVYRVKPEEPKKRWRPFKDTAELLAHNNGHDIMWLIKKENGEKRLITAYGSDYVDTANWNYDMGDLLESFTFADGRPCGVENDA